MIKVLLVDDHQIVLDGLSSILKGVSDIKVVGTALNALDGLEFLETTKPVVDVAVIDIEMPGMDGIEMAEEIKERFKATNILVLSMYKKNEMINGISEAGGLGYIVKNSGKAELVSAIRSVSDGKRYWGKEITQVQIDAIINPKKEITPKSPLLAPISAREKEVLKHVVDGMTSQQIADKLHLSKATVSTHRQHLREKMGVPAKQMIKFAIDNKLV